jgi:hypothetical protein
MTNQNQQRENKIKNILEKIENNELVIKPRIYFHFKFAALLLLLLVIVIVSIFLSSFILFSLDASGRAALMSFGPSGWQVFLILFPWKLTLVEIGLVVLLEYLLRSFRFGYKIPALYLFLGVVTLILISGVVIDQTPLHPNILKQDFKEQLPPPFSDLYNDVRRPPSRDSGIFSGKIEEVDEISFLVSLDNPKGRGPTTPVIVDFSDIKEVGEFMSVGDRVFIKGRLKEGFIKAVQIKKIKALSPSVRE